MFKKLSVFLVLVLVIGALSACAAVGTVTSGKLSKETKADIARARYVSNYTVDLKNIKSEEKGAKGLYLGEYNGDSYLYMLGFGYAAYRDGEISFSIDSETTAVLKKALRREEDLPTSLFLFKKAAIEKAWLEWNMVRYNENPDAYLGKWSDDESPANCHYYGSCSGYDIVFWVTGSTHAIESITIAGETFQYGCPFQLIGYKNGVAYGLDELYENGKISAEAIKTIAGMHKDINYLLRNSSTE